MPSTFIYLFVDADGWKINKSKKYKKKSFNENMEMWRVENGEWLFMSISFVSLSKTDDDETWNIDDWCVMCSRE